MGGRDGVEILLCVRNGACMQTQSPLADASALLETLLLDVDWAWQRALTT